MNVIKHSKRGGGPWRPGRGKPLGSQPGTSRNQRTGGVAADFSQVEYRPRPREEWTSSNSSEMRTPSNLVLGMAISSASAARRSSSSSNVLPSSSTLSQGAPHVFAVPGTSHSSRTPSSSSKLPTSSCSDSFSSSKYPLRMNAVTPRTNLRQERGTPAQGYRPSPQSVSTSAGEQNTSHVIVAITEGRGQARGEVGMAIIDTRRPKLILCQLSDRQTYYNTLTKINIFHPVEILFPNTFLDSSQPNRLYQVLEANFPHIRMVKVQRRLFKESEGIEKLQHLCLPENESCQLIVKDKFYALAATAALLRYVEFVQNVIFSAKSIRVEYQGAHEGTVIDLRTAQALELLLNQGTHTPDYTLLALLDYCCTHGGRRMLRASILHPPCSLMTITHRQDGVQELVEDQNTARQIRELLKQIPDVEQLLTLCMQTPSNIDSNQSMETRVNYVILLKSTLDVLPQLVNALCNCKSHLHCKQRECFEDHRRDLMKTRILETLNDDVKTPKGSKTATFQRCFAVKAGINELLDVARKTYCELISDMYDEVTQLEGQLSIPLKMNYSSTKGYHIVITPQRNRPVKEADLPPNLLQVQRSRNSLSCTTDILIHANERLKVVSTEILTMSNTLLTVLLNDIRQYIGYLYDMCESIAELDLILSLSQISSSADYVRPHFDDFMKIVSSRHPILESISTCDPVANDVEATSWSNLSIITGPNMSGKSSYIKQVLLLQIMAQIGCYVPAGEARFRITDRIFSHLNFDDSIENNESTLSLELQEVNLIMTSLTARSLVALDELCRGTSVEEGTALAWTICEDLSQSTAFVFVTTHFVQLTTLASVYPCIRNFHLETIEQTSAEGKTRLTYTHRLMPGANPVKNYGLRLAETFNIPRPILDDAWGLANRIETRTQNIIATDEGDEAYTLFKAFQKLCSLATKDDLTTEELLAVREQIRADLAAAKAREQSQQSPKNMPASAGSGRSARSSDSTSATAAIQQNLSPSSEVDFLDSVSTHAEDATDCTSHTSKSPAGSVTSAWSPKTNTMDPTDFDDVGFQAVTGQKGTDGKSMRLMSFNSTLGSNSNETWVASDPKEDTFSCHSNETWVLSEVHKKRVISPIAKVISPILMYDASMDSSSAPIADTPSFSLNSSYCRESVFSVSPLKGEHSSDEEGVNNWEKSLSSSFHDDNTCLSEDFDSSLRVNQRYEQFSLNSVEKPGYGDFLSEKQGQTLFSFQSDSILQNTTLAADMDDCSLFSPMLTAIKKRTLVSTQSIPSHKIQKLEEQPARHESRTVSSQSVTETKSGIDAFRSIAFSYASSDSDDST